MKGLALFSSHRLGTVVPLAAAALLVPWAFAQSSPCKDLLSKQTARIVADKAALAVAPEADKKKWAIALETDVDNFLGDPQNIAICRPSNGDNAAEATIRSLIERARVDKQIGAGSGASGSTTAVGGGSVPALLGVALESGAVVSSTSGSAVTYRTNPAKLIAGIAKAYGQPVPSTDPGYIVLSRLSLALTFDTTRTGIAEANSGTSLTARFRQVSEFSARVDIINNRDLFSKEAVEELRRMRASPSIQGFVASAETVTDMLFRRPDYLAQKRALIAAIVDGTHSTAEIEKDLEAYFDEVAAARDADLGRALDAVVANWTKFKSTEKAMYRKIAKSQILTFEYTFARPPIVTAQSATEGTAAVLTASTGTPPDHHIGRLIYANRFVGDSEFTLTASAGFFHEARPEMRGMWRDLQLGGKLDVPLPELPSIGNGALTFSGLYMHLHQKPLGFDLKINDEKINKPGNIGLFQARFSLPLGDSGVSVPVSFSYSNRTELVKESEVRGNIGMTFDLDKLFAQARQ